MTHNPLPQEAGFMERFTDFFGSVKGILAMFTVEVAYAIAASTSGLDKYPFQFFTYLISLFAITTTQMVMIVQNRQGAILEMKAAHERENVERDLATDAEALVVLHRIREHLGC